MPCLKVKYIPVITWALSTCYAVKAREVSPDKSTHKTAKILEIVIAYCVCCLAYLSLSIWVTYHICAIIMVATGIIAKKKMVWTL